jgi:hypothetical protein
MKYIYAMLDEMSEDELETSTLGRPGGLNKAKAGEAENFNGRSTLKDWAKALKLDPSLVVARLALVLWNASAIQKNGELPAECLLFIGMVHEDYSELDLSMVSWL